MISVFLIIFLPIASIIIVNVIISIVVSNYSFPLASTSYAKTVSSSSIDFKIDLNFRQDYKLFVFPEYVSLVY